MHERRGITDLRGCARRRWGSVLDDTTEVVWDRCLGLSDLERRGEGETRAAGRRVA
jgi:hypothetical protein